MVGLVLRIWVLWFLRLEVLAVIILARLIGSLRLNRQSVGETGYRLFTIVIYALLSFWTAVVTVTILIPVVLVRISDGRISSTLRPHTRARTYTSFVTVTVFPL